MRKWKGLPMFQDTVVYTYLNRHIYSAVDTPAVHFNDMIAYLLSERLIEGPTAPLEFDNRMLNYMVSCLGELDKPIAEVIYEEMRRRVAEVTQDLVYQALLTSGEFYLKYDYDFNEQFTKIRLYVDNEPNWPSLVDTVDAE